MMKALLKQQRGVSLGGLVMVLVGFVFLAMISMKLIPAYMENSKIQRALNEIVHDPALQSATPAEIKDSFSKRANVMDDVTAVSPNDLEMSKDNGVLTLSVSYSVKIPFAGNVSLLIDFKPTSK
jgi:hypothetical protein